MTTTKSAAKAATKLDIKFMDVAIKGTSALICHQWSEKAKKMMRDKQQKKVRGAKEAKDPEAEFNAARYLNEKGEDCFPANGFKQAIVKAGRFDEDWKMTVLRGAVYVEGDLLRIEHERVENVEDMVRVGQGTADLRYRPYYHGWSARLPISYNAAVISKEQVIDLVSQAGFAVGIGDWRPEKNGQHGRWKVETVEDK